MVVIAVRLFAMLDGAGDRHGRPPPPATTPAAD
jgi:hypothetical protein